MPRGKPLSAAHKRAISNSLKGKSRGGASRTTANRGKKKKSAVAKFIANERKRARKQARAAGQKWAKKVGLLS